MDIRRDQARCQCSCWIGRTWIRVGFEVKRLWSSEGWMDGLMNYLRLEALGLKVRWGLRCHVCRLYQCLSWFLREEDQ